MAVRQYIGARYVPEFFYGENGSPEWVSGVAYDALTIVTRLNNSFTSRKPVPSSVGAPESNPEYWACTGNFNSQLDHVADTVDYRTTEKYVIIGSSIGLSNAGTLQGGFQQNTLDDLGIDEDDYYNSAVSGSGFTAGSSKFIDQLQTAINTLDDDFKNANVRIITIGGMNNDSSNLETFLTYVDAFVTLAKANFAHCTIEYVPISWSRSHAERQRLRGMIVQTIPSMQEHGVHVWSGCYGIMHNYVEWFRDDKHFSSAGEKMAERIFAGIINKSFDPFVVFEGFKTFADVTITGLNEALSGLSFGTAIAESFDGNNIMLYGGTNTFIHTKSDATLEFGTAASSPTVLCDNPFRYIKNAPFSAGMTYNEFTLTIKCGDDEVDAVMYINNDDKMCVYVREAMTVPANTYANFRFTGAIVPKYGC